MMRFFLSFIALSLASNSHALTYSTITGTPTNPINYINYEIGGYYLNQAGADVVTTGAGRWKKAGNSATHTITLYNTSGTVLRTATVNMSGPEPAGAFVTANWNEGDYTLAAGSACYILSTEIGGSESFWGQQGITNTVPFGSIYIGDRQGSTLSNQYPNGATQTLGPVTFTYSAPVANYSYNAGAHTYTFPGGPDFFSVTTALQLAVSGDTVYLGAGTPTWFAGGAKLTVKAGVTLEGAGVSDTIITMSSGSVTGYSDASITLQEGAIAKGFTILGPDSDNAVPFQTTTNAGTWRITEVNYTQFPGRQGYFLNVNKAPSGRVDNCVITGAHGSSELILVRGPDNAWQQPSGIGDANAVYIERNTISGQGYVCDVNDNGKAVVRFNTITGKIKVDGHGRASNSIRGVRRLEAYNNIWTINDASFWTAIEARGGKNMIFSNSATASFGGAATFQLRDYGYGAMYVGFLYQFQTPNNYPLLDQIGTGQDATVAATSLGARRFVKIASVGTTDFTLVGASSNTVGLWFFLTGTPTGTGTVTTNGTADPSYVFANMKNGSAWPRTTPPISPSGTYTTNTTGYAIGATSFTLASISTNTYVGNAISFPGDANRYRITNSPVFGSNKLMTIAAPGLAVAIPASATAGTVSALTMYQYQESDSAATFTEKTIVEAGRDFMSDAGFDSANTGVVVGIAADMGSAAGKLNQGYWATDEGSWNTENNTPGTPGYQQGQGRLYVSDNTNWVLTYTPYTYPYGTTPPPTPVFTSATTNALGNEIAITFSISCTTGAGGNGGVTIAASGGAVTWTYVGGSGTDTYRGSLSRVIYPDEDVLVSYAQPGDGIRSTDDEIDVDSFDLLPVINNSSAGLTVNVTTLNVDALIIGN